MWWCQSIARMLEQEAQDSQALIPVQQISSYEHFTEYLRG